MSTHTYRVVVVRDGKPGFTGASGVYPSHFRAWHELNEIARTWVGLAEPQWNSDFTVFTVRPRNMPKQTYSILTERKSA